MTYVTLHETLHTTIEAKRELYKKLTMQAFVRGLREPLGSRIRCMRPNTIEKALEYVQEETNVMYLQQRNNALPKSFHLPLVPKNNNFMPFSNATPNVPMPKPFVFPNFGQPPNNNWQRSMQPPTPPQFRPNPQGNQPPFRMPTRTQQMFRAPPPNYNPHSNVFRLPQRNIPNPNTGARPMSGVSHFVPRPLPPSGHDWRKFGNPPPNNYFKSRDVNMTDCETYYDYYDDNYDYYTSDYYDCDGATYDDYYNYNYYENQPQVDTSYELPVMSEPSEPQPGPSSINREDFREDAIIKKPK